MELYINCLEHNVFIRLSTYLAVDYFANIKPNILLFYFVMKSQADTITMKTTTLQLQILDVSAPRTCCAPHFENH